MSTETPPPEWPSVWDFGLAPLPQAIAFAGAVRSLTEAVLSLDAPSERLAELIASIRAADAELRASAAVTPRVRIGDHADDPARRPYLDHSVHLSWYNPVFPEYTVTALGPDRAAGTVCFSIAYEGPPGIVHGGFLAVFFDVVTGHQSSQTGLAGKTKSLEIRYLRPTPLGVTLRFEIDRRVDGREIVSAASLFRDSELLCTAIARNVAGDRSHLPAVGARMPGRS
jgi:acyl-coenzyme A thioesterase PaaI-like protein